MGLFDFFKKKPQVDPYQQRFDEYMDYWSFDYFHQTHWKFVLEIGAMEWAEMYDERLSKADIDIFHSVIRSPDFHRLAVKRNIDSEMLNFIREIKDDQYGEIRIPAAGYESHDKYLRESYFFPQFGYWLEYRGTITEVILPELDYDFLHKICIEYMNDHFMAIVGILKNISKPSKNVEKAVTSFMNNPKNQTDIDKILMRREDPKKLGKVIFSYFENPYPMLHYLVKRFRFIYYEENETQPDKFAINDLLIQLGGWSDVKFLSEQGFVDDAERLKFRLLSTASHRLSSLNYEPSLELIEEELSASNHISNNIANETEKQTILQIISELQELKESVKKKTGSTIIIKDSVVMGDVSG